MAVTSSNSNMAEMGTEYKAAEDISEEQLSSSFDMAHNDKENRIVKGYVQNGGREHWTPQEEKTLRRRIDLRLMPILCATQTLQYYSKAMLSQTALFGLTKDLELNVGSRFSFAASIFYLGFLVGAYPGTALAQRYATERVLCSMCVLWGISLCLTTLCKDYRGLYAQRFFQGLLEAGISPIMVLCCGNWFKKNEQAFRIGMWASFNGYTNMIGPLVNYGLGHIHGKLSTWKYMYYFAGGISIIWGFCLLFLLPSDPVRAKFLKPRERYIAVARLQANNAGIRNTQIKLDQIKDLMLDFKFWIAMFMSFFSHFANAPLSTFSSIIINGFGFNRLNSLLLLLPGGFTTGTVQIIATYLSFKTTGMRTYIYFVCTLGTVIGSVLLWQLPLSSKGWLLFGLYILPSVGGSYAVLMGLQLANTAGYTKRSAASAGLYMSYSLGNFAAPFAFRAEDAPRYKPGFIIVIITTLISGLLALVYRVVCKRCNRQRDEAGIVEGFEHAYDDVIDTKNPQFRYIL